MKTIEINNKYIKKFQKYVCPICGKQIGKEYIQYVLIHAKHIKYPISRFLRRKNGN